MKKNIYLFAIPFFAVIGLLLANSSGSPGGITGSPGDGGTTCVQCHTGTGDGGFYAAFIAADGLGTTA
jgi:hypothetical protein